MQEGEITMEELETALKGTSIHKAAGSDGIPAGAWLELGESKGATLAFLNMCWDTDAFPDEL